MFSKQFQQPRYLIFPLLFIRITTGGIIFPRGKGMKTDRRRKRERKGWKNSRARNTKYYTIFSTRVVSDEKLEIRKTNGSTGGTITRREFSPISFVRFRSASRAWQTWSERNRSLYPLRFFFPLLLPLLPHSPSHSTARLLFVLLLFVLQTQLVQSTLVVRADGGL